MLKLKKTILILCLVIVPNIKSMEIPLEGENAYLKQYDDLEYYDIDTHSWVKIWDYSLFLKNKNKKDFGGMVSIQRNTKTNEGSILRLEIFKDYRNKGYGTSLFRTVCKHLLQNLGCKSVDWTVQPLDDANNKKLTESLIRFYTRNGGTIIGKTKSGSPRMRLEALSDDSSSK